MSPCMLSLHLFLGRPRLLLPETSSLSDFAQMWLGSRLKQWPNHFSLLFSRKVSTGFTWASFLMSSFLMWSNLFFPLAHLNILISAEFILLSSFFFTAQHSEPYVMAGLMIVLKTLSFNSTGIFLSHIRILFRVDISQSGFTSSERLSTSFERLSRSHSSSPGFFGPIEGDVTTRACGYFTDRFSSARRSHERLLRAPSACRPLYHYGDRSATWQI